MTWKNYGIKSEPTQTQSNVGAQTMRILSACHIIYDLFRLHTRKHSMVRSTPWKLSYLQKLPRKATWNSKGRFVWCFWQEHSFLAALKLISPGGFQCLGYHGNVWMCMITINKRLVYKTQTRSCKCDWNELASTPISCYMPAGLVFFLLFLSFTWAKIVFTCV